MFKQTPPVTRNLIIINILMFFAQYVFERYGIDLTSLLGLHFVLAGDFAVWQLVTYLFLHSGFTHIFFNMFSLYMFGSVLAMSWGDVALAAGLSAAVLALFVDDDRRLGCVLRRPVGLRHDVPRRAHYAAHSAHSH